MSKVLVWRADEKAIYTKQMGKERKERELIIGDSYRKVEDEALRNNIRVRKVLFQDSIKEIGVRSFHNCTNLHQVELGKVERIQKEAFYNCVKIRELCFPKELQRLGRSSFARCKRLTDVDLSRCEKLSVIEENTFSECGNMKSCKLNNQIEVIRSKAFYKCDALDQIVFPAKLRKIGKESFYQTSLSELQFPQTLEMIEESAFLKCNQLEYVQIPVSVRVLERWAFHGCNRLQVLEIRHDPEIIGEEILNRSARVRCYSGSKVEKYCKEAGLEVEYL